MVCAYTGTFQVRTGTGTQTITGVGFTPKTVIFQGGSRTTAGVDDVEAFQMFGVTDGTTSYAYAIGYDDGTVCGRSGIRTAAVAMMNQSGTVTLDGTLCAFNCDGFVLCIGTNTEACAIIGFTAYGGCDVTNAYVGGFTFPSSTGNFTVTGVGGACAFTPDVIFAAASFCLTSYDSSSNKGFFDWGVADAVSGDEWSVSSGFKSCGKAIKTTTLVDSGHFLKTQKKPGAGQICGEANFVSVASGSWTANASDLPMTAGSKGMYLALEFNLCNTSYDVATFNKSTSTCTPVAQNITAPAFEAGSVIFGNSFQAVDNCAAISGEGGTRHFQGAWTGCNEFSVGGSSWDCSTCALGGSFEHGRFASTTKALSVYNYCTKVLGLVAEADITSHACGFTATWTTNNNVGSGVGYFAINAGSAATTFCKTYTVDAAFQELAKTKTYTIDSLFRFLGRTKTHTIDSVYKALVKTKTYTIDSIYKLTTSATHTIDAVYKKLSNPKTYTIDSVYRDLALTKTYTIDSVYALKGSATHMIDAVYKTLATAKTYTIDSIYKALATGKTYTIDSGYKALGVAKTFTIDARFLGATLVNYTIDAAYRSLGLTKTFTVDAAFQKQYSKTYTLDSVYRILNSVTHTIDSVYKALANTKTFTIDSLYKALGNTKTYTIDASFKLVIAVTHTIDSVYKALSNPKTYTIDSVYKALANIKTYTIDSVFVNRKIKTFLIDSVYKALVNPKTYTVDSAYKALGRIKTFTIDARFILVQLGTYTIDSIYKALQAPKTYTIDSVFSGGVSVSTDNQTAGATVITHKRRKKSVETNIISPLELRDPTVYVSELMSSILNKTDTTTVKHTTLLGIISKSVIESSTVLDRVGDLVSSPINFFDNTSIVKYTRVSLISGFEKAVKEGAIIIKEKTSSLLYKSIDIIFPEDLVKMLEDEE